MPANSDTTLGSYRTPEYPEMRFAAQLTADGLVAAIRQSVVPLGAASPNSLDTSGPIHVVVGPPIVELATATLFQKCGVPFLISALHVFKTWQANGWELRAGNSRTGRFAHFLPDNERVESNEALDITVIRLNGAEANLFAGNVFLTEDVVDCTSTQPDGFRYLICGYLATQSGSTDAMQSMRLCNYDLWVPEFRGTVGDTGNEATRGLLNNSGETWNPRDVVPTVGTNSLGGMSGANVWRIHHESQVDGPVDWTTVKVVGVQTGYVSGWQRDSLHALE